MFRKVLVVLAILAVAGCSMVGGQTSSSSKSNNLPAYEASLSEQYMVRTYAEHINVVLVKFKSDNPVDRKYFYDRTMNSLVKAKAEDPSLDSAAFVKESFYKWFIDFRFSNGDLEYMSEFVGKTRQKIALKLKKENAGIAVEQSATRNEMMTDLIHDVADFYYCTKMKGYQIEELTEECDVISALKGTEKQQRNQIYSNFSRKYHEMNK